MPLSPEQEARYQELMARAAVTPPPEPEVIPTSTLDPASPDVSGLAARYPFAAGAAQGIGEMAGNVQNLFGIEGNQTVDPAYSEASYEAFSEANPSAELGRKTARMAPALASAALPGGLAAQIGYSAPLAALEEDFATSAVTGAAATGLFGLIGKGINAARGGLSAPKNWLGATKELPEKATEFIERGGYIPSGSAVEQMASKHPWTAAPFRNAAEKNLQMLTDDALAALGNVTDNLTDEGLEEAARVLGSRFDTIGEMIPPVKVPKYVGDVLEALDPRAKTLAEITDDLTRPVLEGRSVMTLRSRLGDLAQSSDDLVARAANKARRVLDDAISDAAPENVAPAWRQLREQWRNLEWGVKKITSATGRDPLTGQIQPAVTTRRLRNVYSKGPATQAETKQLQDTAAVLSSDLFKAFEPNPSGTAAALGVLDLPSQLARAPGALGALVLKGTGGATAGAVGRAGALELLPEESDENIPALLRLPK